LFDAGHLIMIRRAESVERDDQSAFRSEPSDGGARPLSEAVGRWMQRLPWMTEIRTEPVAVILKEAPRGLSHASNSGAD
jgi:hypothetical protein